MLMYMWLEDTEAGQGGVGDGLIGGTTVVQRLPCEMWQVFACLGSGFGVDWNPDQDRIFFCQSLQ